MKWLLGLGVLAGLGGVAYLALKGQETADALKDPSMAPMTAKTNPMLRFSAQPQIGLIQTSRRVQRVGSLHMPQDSSIHPRTQVGLIEVQQRYRPRNGVNL